MWVLVVGFLAVFITASTLGLADTNNTGENPWSFTYTATPAPARDDGLIQLDLTAPPLMCESTLETTQRMEAGILNNCLITAAEDKALITECRNTYDAVMHRAKNKRARCLFKSPKK